MRVEHLVELLHRQVLEVRVAEHAGVRDDRVDRSECLERPSDDRSATLGGGDGVVRCDRLAAGGHDLRHDGVGVGGHLALTAEVVDDDGRRRAARDRVRAHGRARGPRR